MGKSKKTRWRTFEIGGSQGELNFRVDSFVMESSAPAEKCPVQSEKQKMSEFVDDDGRMRSKITHENPSHMLTSY